MKPVPVSRPKPAEWLSPQPATIPGALRELSRWFLWTRSGDGRKQPKSVERPEKNIIATNPANWRSWEQVIAGVARHAGCGFGFALGSIDDGPTIAGVDLDHCRDPHTGAIEPWARRIIDYMNSYTEVSPSGTGLKVFVFGSLPDGAKQGKRHQLEIYDRDRYFTVTGHHLEDTPNTVEHRGAELRDLHAKAWSRSLLDVVRVFDLFIRQRGEWIDIRCPWADEHSQPDQPRDAALHVTNEQVDGFQCFHASHAEKSLGDVYRFFGMGAHGDFETDAKGRVLPTQANIRLALAKVGVSVFYNTFTDKTLLTSGDVTRPLDDAHGTRVWLAIDEQCGFRPSKDFFYDVVANEARRQSVHPVRDYLDRVKWDGTPRLDAWLCTYGGAKDTKLTRAIGAIVLIAAVRRARQPGVKFDELLVLVSPQGQNKSSALRALCPDDAWFSDDLPLNVEAKQIIERTAGKWLIEAAELSGLRKSDIEHLKATLSRQVDGPVRLAYDRLPTERPRQFVVIGTTNPHQFLKDKSGNRRFWPVRVQRFDTERLRADRDQLWAEAAHREATGASIRLDASLYQAAEREQERHAVDDPWTAPIRELLGLDSEAPDFVPVEVKTRVKCEDVWVALGLLDHSRRTERDAERINAIMQSLGYEKKTARPAKGEKPAKCWRKPEPDELELEAEQVGG